MRCVYYSLLRRLVRALSNEKMISFLALSIDQNKQLLSFGFYYYEILIKNMLCTYIWNSEGNKTIQVVREQVFKAKYSRLTTTSEFNNSLKIFSNLCI